MGALDIAAALIGIVGGLYGLSEYLKRIRFIRVRIARRDDALIKSPARCLLLRIEQNRALRSADFKDTAIQRKALALLERYPNWHDVEPNGGTYWTVRAPGKYLLLSRLYVKGVLGDVSQVIDVFNVFDAERGYEYQFEMRETAKSFVVQPLGRHKVE